MSAENEVGEGETSGKQTVKTLEEAPEGTLLFKWGKPPTLLSPLYILTGQGSTQSSLIERES